MTCLAQLRTSLLFGTFFLTHTIHNLVYIHGFYVHRRYIAMKRYCQWSSVHMVHVCLCLSLYVLVCVCVCRGITELRVRTLVCVHAY